MFSGRSIVLKFNRSCKPESIALNKDRFCFEAQDITTEVVPTLSDAQLIQLGLTTLGKRQLLN